MDKDTLVLVVDDAEINLRIAEKIIAREYSVKCIDTGEGCLEFLENQIPDLILLDLHMPEMDGFEVMEKLQSSIAWRNIPVIFLTADNEHDAEVQGFELGAMDFITKPFVAEVMLKRVGRVLELSRLQKNLSAEVEKQTAVAEERRQKVENMSIRMIHALAVTLDAKDAYTNGHSSRVADYSVMLAKEIGWPDERLEDLYNAAVLHDIGKIGVPDRVLNKPGGLNDEEYDIIKSHTVVGAEILVNAAVWDLADDVARHHHERFDGKGYPDGLKGDEIPLSARIVCVADAYDAMNSRRVYRYALPRNVIREELVRGSGLQFDPELVDAFLRIFDRGGFDKNDEIIGKDINTQNMRADNISNGFERDDIFSRGEGMRTISESMSQNKGCLVLFDLDNLKLINEKEGHTLGDQALDSISEILAKYDKGIACRHGGDEFLLFIPGAGKEEGVKCTQEVFDEFEKKKGERPEFGELSLSAGLCLSNRQDSFDAVYAMADKALYYVKQSGKAGLYFYETADSFEKNYSNIELALLLERLKAMRSGKILESSQDKGYYWFLEKVINDQNKMQKNFAFLMITLENGPGETHFVEELDGAMKCLEYATNQVLGTLDNCFRYSNVQYLIVCPDGDKAEMHTAAERIINVFFKHSGESRLLPSYATEVLNY